MIENETNAKQQQTNTHTNISDAMNKQILVLWPLRLMCQSMISIWSEYILTKANNGNSAYFFLLFHFSMFRNLGLFDNTHTFNVCIKISIEKTFRKMHLTTSNGKPI